VKVYDFKCGDCGNIYEAFVREGNTTSCRECGQTEDQEKLLTFKGYAAATDDDSPRTQEDLQNYLGHGQYNKGYKKSEWKRTK
jgi:hypothetical protein